MEIGGRKQFDLRPIANRRYMIGRGLNQHAPFRKSQQRSFVTRNRFFIVENCGEMAVMAPAKMLPGFSMTLPLKVRMKGTLSAFGSAHRDSWSKHESRPTTPILAIHALLTMPLPGRNTASIPLRDSEIKTAECGRNSRVWRNRCSKNSEHRPPPGNCWRC